MSICICRIEYLENDIHINIVDPLKIHIQNNIRNKGGRIIML